MRGDRPSCRSHGTNDIDKQGRGKRSGMAVTEAINQLMHSPCLYELEHRSAQLVVQGQVRLDDGAMTHWRPDKRAHSDGPDDISTGLHGTTGRAIASAPHPIAYAFNRDPAVFVTDRLPSRLLWTIWVSA